jgi:tetratricopeptide (TPR) repeat protein
MFERALALYPHNARAMTGLAIALFARPYAGWSDDPATDVARAEKTADAALALRTDDSDAHMVKSYIFETKGQPRAALAEAETAIADDPNNARAIEHAGFLGGYFGHSEDGVAAVETALRLSPHDPTAPVMQVHLCYLHGWLARARARHYHPSCKSRPARTLDLKRRKRERCDARRLSAGRSIRA